MNSSVKIVMIEDDAGHARLIEKNIRRAGVNNELVHYKNGSDALAYFADKEASNNHAHLILLDLNLPDMSGTEILERIKKNAEHKCTPIIVLTTTDDKKEIQKCYDLGCSVYITKPLSYESFSESIRKLGLFMSVIKLPAQNVS